MAGTGRGGQSGARGGAGRRRDVAAGVLLRRAGHDVRGPAGVIAGALDEIERALGAEAAGGSAPLFTMARRGVRRLLLLADRYTTLSELSAAPAALAAHALDLAALVRAAVAEASFVYGRRGVDVALELPAVRAVAHARWMTAAIADAALLALCAARARVVVGLDGGEGRVRVAIAVDAGAAAIERAFVAAGSSSPSLSDEGALPARVLVGVLGAHRGEARVERSGEGARILLEWPASEAEGGA